MYVFYVCYLYYHFFLVCLDQFIGNTKFMQTYTCSMFMIVFLLHKTIVGGKKHVFNNKY